LAVTGARGLLGSNFVWAAREKWQVIALHRSRPPIVPGVEGAFLDLANLDGIGAALDLVQPEIIVHFAAATAVDWCEEHRIEAEHLNVKATQSLAQWAAANQARLILMSTDSVFDGKGGPYRESDPPAPVNFYATTKWQAEQMVAAITQDHLIIRASFHGWNGEAKLSLSEWILDRLMAGKPMLGFLDVRFSPLLANTLAESILNLIECGARGTYHAASADATSKHDFAVMVAEVFGLDGANIRGSYLEQSPLRARRPFNTTLRSDKLHREIAALAPSIRQDLERFRFLRDSGFVSRLKTAFV